MNKSFVGASVVNALSEWLEVEVCRDKKRYLMRFENGGKKVSKLQELGATNRTGSKVTFMPDKKIFQTTNFNFQTIVERAQEEAFLLKNVKLTVKDERSGDQQEFLYKEGLKHIKISGEQLGSRFLLETELILSRRCVKESGN